MKPDDRAAIRNLLARYCHGVDSRSAGDVAMMFTSDGTLRFSEHGVYTGRDSIRAFLEKVPAGPIRHLIGESDIQVSNGTATAVTSFMVARRSGDGPVTLSSAGWYEDQLARDADAGWRFTHRAIFILEVRTA